MYHSITIKRNNSNGTTTTKNTWTDWYLIPTARPSVNPATPSTKFIEIPGRNGSLDMSVALTGSPTYGDRKGTWEFYIMREKWDSWIAADPVNRNYPNGWVAAYQVINNFLNGRIFQATLEDDPSYYYQGRIYVSGYRPQKDYSIITFDYTFEPYKINASDATDKKL